MRRRFTTAYGAEDGQGDTAAAPRSCAGSPRTARGDGRGLVCRGFVHGVLNTDNINITGESFDYGPYRFLPRLDPNFTAAYFDQRPLCLWPPAEAVF